MKIDPKTPIEYIIKSELFDVRTLNVFRDCRGDGDPPEVALSKALSSAERRLIGRLCKPEEEKEE